MTVNKPMNLAMIGCGGYAAYLRGRIEELPEVCRLVAVTTRDLESPTARECRKAGLAVYQDVDEMLDALSPEECPAVVIPTSIESHFEYTETAVSKGFHVLLEKPPVATIQDLDRLIELQRLYGKWIAVNFQHLFNASTQSIKQRLFSGEFGAIKSVYASALWPRAETYFQRSSWSGKLKVDDRWVLDGTVGNPLAHLVAEALYLATTGPGMATPSTVQAELYHANAIESEDTSAMRVETTEGIELFFCASLASKNRRDTACEIRAEKATIRLCDFCQVEVAFCGGRTEQQDFSEEDSGVFSRQGMIRSMIQSLRENQRPLITVEECRSYVLVWNGAFESAGIPAAIKPGFIKKEELDGKNFYCIPGMDRAIQEMVSANRLFSEVGVPWGVPGKVIEMDQYTHFPSVSSELIEMDRCSEECPLTR